MKQLKRIDGKWIDLVTNEEFLGNEKDLAIGDKFIDKQQGKIIEFTVKDKTLMDNGVIHVCSSGVELESEPEPIETTEEFNENTPPKKSLWDRVKGVFKGE